MSDGGGGAQLQELIDEARRLNARLGQSTAGSGGAATINVNMGGWGVAIAVCAALFCLLLVIDMRSDQRDTRRQVERTQDYTNMLWQRYPELRPEKLQEEKK